MALFHNFNKRPAQMDKATYSAQWMVLWMIVINACVCFPSGLRGWRRNVT